MRAAIYVRISQDREGAGLGVGRQEADCRALVDRLGGAVAEVYVDNDLSAYSGRPRPAYQRLLGQIEAGRLDAVVTWHNDRLHRSPLELEHYIAASERYGVLTHSVQAGQIDLSTASGRVHARMLGTFARYESEIKAERVRRKSLQKAQAGEWLGGPIPLGWVKREDGHVVLDRSAARRIRKASEDVLAGASLGGIVRDWNAAGFTTATGKPWNYTTLRQVLRRPRNAGLVDFKGEVLAKSPWPRIVSEEVWRGVRSLLDDPGRRTSRSNRAKWLCSGIATCGNCGTPVKTVSVKNSTGGTDRLYRCPQPGPGHVYRRADLTDEQVRQTVAEWLRRDGALAQMLASGEETDSAEVQAEEMALRQRLVEAAESFADGLVSRVQLEAMTAKINARLDALATEAAGTQRSALLGALADTGDPAQTFLDAPLDRQRAIVRELVTVTIKPRPKDAPRRYLPELTVIRPR